MSELTAQQINKALQKHFSLGELRTLAFELNIPYDDLAGSTRALKTIELVTYAERHGRTTDLINYIRRARPNANLGAPTPAADAAAAAAPSGGPATVYNIHGDYVGRDKIAGDTVKGDKMTDSNKSGDTYNFSGNFSGAMINVNSTLNNVQQTIGALPTANDQAKAELRQLVAQLQDILKQIPPDKAEDAEAVAELTENLMKTANKEKPNKQMLQITGEGLKQAAKNLAAIVPDVTKIAGAIVKAVLAL